MYKRSFLANLFLTFLTVTFISCQAQKTGISANSDNNNSAPPKNIILLIGDGMGFSQVTAAEYEFGKLMMTSLPYHGMTSTYASNAKVTDSASSATAFATGYKTNNGMLGQLPDGTPVRSIAQYANELGKTTALMATSQITHATPAAFAIHHGLRGEEFIIAEKFADSGIDMILGAGWNWFLPESEGGEREDERNLIAEMEEQGYVYISRDDELERMQGENKIVVFLEGGSMPQAPERGDRMVNLTKAALAELSQQENGFFLMIEGSQIDWAGHDNDENWLLAEMADFDAVIAGVFDFAKQDGSTLVVVTADHETGGLTMPSAEGGEMRHMFSTGGHTAQHVPVFSFGPHAEKFKGRYDNTDIAKKMFSIWGYEFED